jgi:DNA-binding Xre family transcriptional regulator
MPTRVYARIEAKKANLTLATVARLCKGLHVSIEDLWRAPPVSSSEVGR